MVSVFRYLQKFVLCFVLFLFLACLKEPSKGLESRLTQENTVTFLLSGLSEDQKVSFCMYGFLFPTQRKLGLLFINPLTSFQPEEEPIETWGSDVNRKLIPYLESLSELKVNYSLQLSEKDFAKIIDLLGGVPFYLDPTIPPNGDRYLRTQGVNLMFGKEVLDFYTLLKGEKVDVYIDRQNLQQSILLTLFDRVRSVGELKKEWIYFFEKAFQSSLSAQDLYAAYLYLLKDHIIFSVSEMPGQVILDEKHAQSKLLAKMESSRLAFEKMVAYLNSGDYAYGELARTEVLNSSEQNGLAKNVKSILNENSFQVLTVDNGWNVLEKKSVVIDRSGNPELSYRIANILGIKYVYHIIDKDLGLDSTVLLGEDFEIKTRK
jgi:polyisoprenyl-teichoic acid--peptidoglycan teichoic acid transferase